MLFCSHFHESAYLAADGKEKGKRREKEEKKKGMRREKEGGKKGKRERRGRQTRKGKTEGIHGLSRAHTQRGREDGNTRLPGMRTTSVREKRGKRRSDRNREDENRAVCEYEK